jgi:hypothetical protein
VQGNDAGRSRRWSWCNVVAVVREGKGNVSLPWRSGEVVLGLVLISAPGRGLQPRSIGAMIGLGLGGGLAGVCRLHQLG